MIALRPRLVASWPIGDARARMFAQKGSRNWNRRAGGARVCSDCAKCCVLLYTVASAHSLPAKYDHRHVKITTRLLECETDTQGSSIATSVQYNYNTRVDTHSRLSAFVVGRRYRAVLPRTMVTVA